MLATIAAVLFGLALLLELLGENIQNLVTTTTLTLAGLVFVALHMAGYGSRSGRKRR